MSITAKKSFIPINVYKAFVKMALSIAPEHELGYLKDTILWILNDANPEITPLLLWQIFMPGRKPYGDTRASLLKRIHNDKKYPAYILMMLFENMQYQIILPRNLLDDGRSQEEFTVHFFPTISERNPIDIPTYWTDDLNRIETITDPDNMEMRYEPRRPEVL